MGLIKIRPTKKCNQTFGICDSDPGFESVIKGETTFLFL